MPLQVWSGIGTAQMDKTAFVTGASAGIGEATARALLAAGYRVFAGARRLDRMAGLAAAGATLLKLDLTDDASIVAAVNTIRCAGGTHRRPGQQCRLRLLRRAGGRAARRRAAAVRGQRVRAGAALPIGPADDARAEVRQDRQRHLDRRKDLGAAGRLVPRHQVRGGRLQRLPARRGSRLSASM